MFHRDEAGTIATDRSKALLAQGDALTSALTAGYRVAFVVAAMGVGIGLLVAAVILRTPRPRLIESEATPIPATDESLQAEAS